MDFRKPTERVSQFSPEAERLIRRRQKSPIYLKLAALVQQDEFTRGETLWEEDQRNARRPSNFIEYLTRIFTSGDEG